MKLDTSKTLIGDLTDNDEKPAKKEEFDFDTLKSDADKKKKEKALDVGSIFGNKHLDKNLDENYKPKKNKINNKALLIVIIISIFIIIGIFVYLFTK